MTPERLAHHRSGEDFASRDDILELVAEVDRLTGALAVAERREARLQTAIQQYLNARDGKYGNLWYATADAEVGLAEALAATSTQPEPMDGGA